MIPSTSAPVKNLFRKWLESFNEESMTSLMLTVKGVERVLTIMLIHLCFPDLRLDCQSVCSIPLSSFKSISSIIEYSEAIIKSGVSEDLRGRLFVLGNTDVGKAVLYTH